MSYECEKFAETNATVCSKYHFASVALRAIVC
jgi:hypothetical protein